MSCFIPNWITSELVFSNNIRKIQEWLVFHKYYLVIDGNFGPVTRAVIKVFQKNHHLVIHGIVDQRTFDALITPLRRALDISFKVPVDKYIVAIAKQHLKQNVCEIGGANHGPWVRSYMHGHEGKEWAWCCGMVGFILAQVNAARGIPINNLDYTFSCDILAEKAKKHNKFVNGKELNIYKKLKPGDIFLNRKTYTDWTHTGFIVKVYKGFFVTVEGNSSEGIGSREGTGIFSCIRSYKNKDFIKTT